MNPLADIFSRALPLGLILALPLAGLKAAGRDISPYLVFPPKPVMTAHAPFSLPIFCLILALVLVSVLPLAVKAVTCRPRTRPGPRDVRSLPWWGKLALAGLVCFWILAWTRFHWFARFQAHTFFPLWLSLILVINGMTVKRCGTCPMTASPARFLMLFPVSALFWWTFEYLNRFVGNWYYTGSQYPAFTYFLLATLSFSTVLPAVESMAAFLLSFQRIRLGFSGGPALPRLTGRAAGYLYMGLGSISLALIGIFPDPLFFTVWIAPFFIILGHALVRRLPHPFEGLVQGDLTPVATYALAALCCGLCWELFNVYSLARWSYSIPYVQAVHIFEMPVLGFAGYLPFGLECALIIHLIYKRTDPHES